MTRRFRLALLLLIPLAGCGNWQRVGSNRQPSPEQTLTQLFDMPAVYHRLGRLAAGAPLPFVGTVSFAAAPGDSVKAVVGLSIENRALVFQKEGDTFVARYRVEVAFQRAGAAPVQVGRDEEIRVATFQETLRNDESVLFQQFFQLVPGDYHVVVVVRDRAAPTQNRAEGDFTAPHFGPGSTSVPMLVYQVTGRGGLADPLQLVLNPRGTVAYGGDTLLAYVEGYDFPKPTAVPFEILDQDSNVVHADSLRFRGGLPLEGQVIRLAPDSQPLGELTLVVGRPPNQRKVSAIVSFSQAWVLTNFDEMLHLLRYFGHDNLVHTLREAPVADRAQAWRTFWLATDPNKSTPENEALDEYFRRIAAANASFRDEGVSGWRTDRGEVFIALGPPDEVYDASPLSQGRIIRWVYITLRLDLFFRDDTGFGRFRLVPSSRAAFEQVRSRLERQNN